MLQGSVNKVDSLNSASGLYSFNSKGTSFIHGLVSFFYSGVGAAAIPARLRLRKNFGERAFSPAAVLVSLSFYIFLCSRIIFLFPDDNEDDSFIEIGMIIFLLIPFNSFSLSLIKTIKIAYKHFKEIYSYSEEQSYKYSYYRGVAITDNYLDKIGTTIFGYEVDEKVIRMYFEPKGFAIEHLKKMGISMALVIPAGFFAYGLTLTDYTGLNFVAIGIALATFWLFTYSFSNFCLAFSGFCLLIEELSIAKKIRDTILDTIDGEYDMQFIMKQKEAFQSSDGGEASLDIAENVFQNPELSISMASFPVFESIDFNESRISKENSVSNKTSELTTKKRIQTKKVSETKNELDSYLDNILEK